MPAEPPFPGAYDEDEFPRDDELVPESKDEELRLGLLAAKFRNSEAYRELTAALRTLYLDTFQMTPVRDVEGMQLLRVRLQVLDDMDKMLVDTISTGKLARLAIDQQDGQQHTDD